jgi:crossover junction endodeoxyribonuclease RuvC
VKVCGIDPGLTGAIAVLQGDGTLIDVKDLPIVRHKNGLGWVDGSALQSYLIHHCGGPEPCHIIIEHVSSFPGQGISSAFQFGVVFGSILGTCQARHIPLHLVRPHVWKKHHRLNGIEKKKRKAAALAHARLLWPTAELHLARHDGRAEALLVAAWFIEKGSMAT